MESSIKAVVNREQPGSLKGTEQRMTEQQAVLTQYINLNDKADIERLTARAFEKVNGVGRWNSLSQLSHEVYVGHTTAVLEVLLAGPQS